MAGLVIKSPDDVANAVIAHLGYKRRIGSLYDGSDAAKKFLDIYGQARDAKLREFEWGFAERNIILTLLKTAPVGGYNLANPWTAANPPMPWIFEYAYPADMLEIRSLKSSTPMIPNFDPKPVTWRVANDTVAAVQQKVILTHKAAAAACYTAQVTDPALWEVGFTDALIEDLARRMAPALVGFDAEKAEAQEETVITQEAQMRLG